VFRALFLPFSFGKDRAPPGAAPQGKNVFAHVARFLAQMPPFFTSRLFPKSYPHFVWLYKCLFFRGLQTVKKGLT